MAKQAPIILRLTREELEEIASWPSMIDSEWGRAIGPKQEAFDSLREKLNKLADEYEVEYY